jgi:hypothetical protein
VATEQRLVTTYLGPDLLERAQSWGLIFVTLGAGIFLACLGAWLFLKSDTKEIVKVEVPPAQIVKVEVPTSAPAAQPAPPPPAPQPDMSQYVKRSDLPAKTSTGEPIQREVTVFSKVEHPPGTVLTGWTFKDGAAGSPPIHQYCYYMDGQPTNDNPKTGVVYIATNGTVLESADKSAVPDYPQALTKCQWFDGSSTQGAIDAPRVNRVTTVPYNQQILYPPDTTSLDRIKSFVANWSDPTTPLATIDSYYADSVFYFGKQSTHEEVVTDIARNAGRWPIRRYTIYNNQIETKCFPAGEMGKYTTVTTEYTVCDVTATIEWHVANEQRKVGGLTQAFYELAVNKNTGQTEIHAQTEKVTNRHPD